MAENVVMQWLRDFITALFADIVYGKGLASRSAKVGEVAATVGSQLRATWWPSLADEAAFQLALSALEPWRVDKIARWVHNLGDPKKDDTPEARIFRKTLITIPNEEQRVQVLRALSELPEDTWCLCRLITR